MEEKKEFKVIIFGPKDFNDYEFLKQKCNNILSKKLKDPDYKVTIVSAHSPGVCLLGERYAKEYNIPVQIITANWDKYGKKAGVYRNKKMAEISNACIVFYIPGGDELNRGVKNMVSIAQENKLLLREISPKPNI